MFKRFYNLFLDRFYPIAETAVPNAPYTDEELRELAIVCTHYAVQEYKLNPKSPYLVPLPEETRTRAVLERFITYVQNSGRGHLQDVFVRMVQQWLGDYPIYHHSIEAQIKVSSSTNYIPKEEVPEEIGKTLLQLSAMIASMDTNKFSFLGLTVTSDATRTTVELGYSLAFKKEPEE